MSHDTDDHLDDLEPPTSTVQFDEQHLRQIEEDAIAHYRQKRAEERLNNYRLTGTSNPPEDVAEVRKDARMWYVVAVVALYHHTTCRCGAEYTLPDRDLFVKRQHARTNTTRITATPFGLIPPHILREVHTIEHPVAAACPACFQPNVHEGQQMLFDPRAEFPTFSQAPRLKQPRTAPTPERRYTLDDL